jgi:hypothetical protein
MLRLALVMSALAADFIRAEGRVEHAELEGFADAGQPIPSPGDSFAFTGSGILPVTLLFGVHSLRFAPTKTSKGPVMATKTKSKAAAQDWASPADLLLMPVFTTEERLQRLQILGQRIDGYIRFMSKISAMNGVSREAKDKAVTRFYDRLTVLERDLERIREEVWLG